MQNAVFAICAFGLIGQVAEVWRTRRLLSLVLLVVAATFIANILYVATARTTLVVMGVMLVLFGIRRFGWKGALGTGLISAGIACAAWASSPYLHQRVSVTAGELQAYYAGNVDSPTGLRLEYWKKSLALIAEAPLIGHGTGTIPRLFRRDVTGATIPALITTNPHNQILAVTIELGLIGALVLVAMWVAHLGLFRDGTLIA
jgi:O-antigen ligase